MIEFIQHVINGISLGSIYALIALGYTMVFGVLQLINFAHGDITMMGAFIAYYASRFFLSENFSFISLIFILSISMVSCAILGFWIEKLAYRPLRRSSRVNILITAVGVSLLLEFVGQALFGTEPKFFPQLFENTSYLCLLGSIKVQWLQVFVFSVSLILMMLLRFIVFKTKLGKAMRAVSFNQELASLMGIPTDTVISLTFVIGSALAGAAGVLVGLTYPKIEPLMGVMPGLKAFISAVLGGIGNISGAVLGAFCLGLAEEFLVGYWAPSFRDALAFSLLILTLIIKPTGLLGNSTTEKV